MSGHEKELLVEERGRILLLTLNRPQARNAINLALATQLAEAMDLLDSRDDLSVGVLAGNGPAFCAGMDLKAFAAGETPRVPDRGFAGLVEKPGSKPLIAAVDGFALAGGFEIVLACDIVVASEAAVFGLPEVKRGLCAGGGGLLRLTERIPYHVAMEIALTGDDLSARRAGQLGLVNRLVPTDARSTALELAEQIAANAPLALAATKRVMVESRDWTLDEAFARQEVYIDPVRRSRDALEGAVSFAEKRPAHWTGS